MLGENSGRPGPGLGTLPASWLDLGMLQAATRRVLADERDDDRDATALHYGDPAGDARLRAALCARLADFGVRAVPGQLVTAVGATQALDLISRAVLAPGDAVLVDEPGWSVEYARLTQLGMRLLPVPRGPDGPRPGGARHAGARAPPASVRHRLGAAQPDRRRCSPWPARTGCCSWPRRTTSPSSRTTPTPTSRPRTRRGWPRSTACSAPSTSAASRRSWRWAGASASSPRRRAGSTG